MPLDVSTSVGAARAHSSFAVAAWVISGLLAALIAPAILRTTAWPRPVANLSGEVVALDETQDGTYVSFAAPWDERIVAWMRLVKESSWELGQAARGAIGDDDRVYRGSHVGFAGEPFLLGGLMFLFFVGWELRRYVALQIAWWDLRHGNERPRRGYVAFIDDPVPRTWRSPLAIWWRDPTGSKRLKKPDAVYRADEDTGEELLSPNLDVAVFEAWIDTGRFRFSKPRWIGTTTGVLIPHRRALFGRLYVHLLTRKASHSGPVPLSAGPPDPRFQQPVGIDEKPPRFVPMLGWRAIGTMLFVAGGVALAAEDGDLPVTAPRPQEIASVVLTRVASAAAEADLREYEVSGAIGALAREHEVEEFREGSWRMQGQDVAVEIWDFPRADDAAATARGELALRALAGETTSDGIVVSRAEDGSPGAFRVFTAGDHVLFFWVFGDDPAAQLDNLWRSVT